MKNKKLHLVTLGFSLFREKFLVLETGAEAVAQSQEEAKASQKEKLFFERMTAAIGSGYSVEFDPKSSPYADQLSAFVKGLPDLSVITFKPNPVKQNGQLILKYDEAGTEKELKIEGDLYKTVFWKEIGARLEAAFNGKNVSNALLLLGIKNKSAAPKFNELVDKLAKAGKVTDILDTDPLVALALAELEPLRKKLSVETATALAMQKGEIERGKMKHEIEDPALTRILAGKRPEAEDDLAAFMEKEKAQALGQLTAGLLAWKMSPLRRTYKLNAQLWDPKSREGLGKIFKDFTTLGIYKNNRFYQTMFSELGKCFDPGMKSRTDISDAEKMIYADPLNPQNLEQINNPKWRDAGFASAVNSLVAFRDIVVGQDLKEEATRKGVDNLGREPITDVAGKFVKDNVHKFTEAVRTHDWATAAIYVGGIYMIYKAWDKWSKDAEGHDRFPNASKWLFLAGGLYCANIFAKNAGYDVMKKFGMKDLSAEVKGTPLAKFYTLAPAEMKDVDAGIVASMSFVNVKELYGKYQETNDPAIQFMDPAKFPLQFPQFVGMSPVSLKKPKLSDAERDYKKAGHELYMFVQGMKVSYDKTLYRESNITFEQALRDNVLKASTVFDLAVALEGFATEDPEKDSLLAIGGKPLEKMNARMDEVFKDTHLANTSFEVTPDDKNGFNGSIMDYPVVAVIDKTAKTYLIFSKKDYEAAQKTPPKTKAIGSIPFEGNANNAVTALDRAITGKMKDLVGIFAASDKSIVDIKGITYNPSGFWEADLNYRKSNIAKASTAPVKVRVQAILDGGAIKVTDPSNGRLIIQVNDVTDASAVEQSVAMAQLSIQSGTPGGVPDLRVLGWFYRKQAMFIIDRDKTDNEFELKIGNMSETIKMKFDGSNYSFVDPADEKKILQSASFKTEIGRIVVEDETFNKPFEESKGILNEIDKEYFKHFFKNVSSWATNATLGELTRGIRLEHLTGSVAQNYVLGLIDAQKTLTASKIMHALENAGNLSDASASVETISGTAAKDVRAFADKFAKLNAEMKDKGDDWSGVEFDKQVMEPLMEVGTESVNYREWYKRFVGETFFKYGNDSLRKGNALNASTVVGVFAYYTSAVDSSKIDGDLGEVDAAEIAKADAAFRKADSEFKLAPTDKVKEAEATRTKYTLDQLLSKNQRYKDYYLASGYVEYVSNQINKTLDVKGNPDNVQGPGFAYWGIVDFKTFKEDPLSLIAATPQKFIDRRTPMTTSADFKEFDTDGAAGNLGVAVDKVTARDPNIPSALLTKSTGKVDTTSTEFKRWFEACNRMTEMEKMFKERLYDRINKMITIDADKYNPKFREDVLRTWAVGITTPAIYFIDPATGRGIDFRGLNESDTVSWIGTHKVSDLKMGTSQLRTSVGLIEAQIKANPVAVTRDVQEKLVNNAVDKLIEQDIIMHPKTDIDGNPIYYNDINWWQKTKANLKDFWDKF